MTLLYVLTISFLLQYAKMDQNFKNYLKQKGLIKLVQNVPSLSGVLGNQRRQ